MSKIRLNDIEEISPKTENQQKVMSDWNEGNNCVLNGSAGTGKTFLALYLALVEVLDPNTLIDNVVIVRSVVPTRNMGFLPGTEEEKTEAFTGAYKAICNELFNDPTAWDRLQAQGSVEFKSTSFLRGETFNNSIVIVDEMQNLNFHELDSVVTRLGRESRFLLCGDYYQSDFTTNKDRNGIQVFLKILQKMKNISLTEFNWKDIVRSGLVRDYIMTKEMMTKDGTLSELNTVI